ncbi:MAG TPA: 3-keto-5-aminohexanoate cleavage protein [Microbacteriaceae bacterium]|nr:3-keto-5-aminohexanoate cleavage protein [Microbacteriaceae bacterium]
MIWKPYGLPDILNLDGSSFHDTKTTNRWNIPEKITVSTAITGAFFTKKQNKNQPITPDEIYESAVQSVEAGASTIHIHVRDDDGYNVLSPERFKEVIVPLKQAYPDLVVDGCLVPALAGEWDKMLEVLDLGLLDAAPVNATATYIGDSLFAKPAPVLMQKTREIVSRGIKPEIAVYTDADVAIAERFLIDSGLVDLPAIWLVLPGLPGGSPIRNAREMIESITRITGLIREVDPQGKIIISAAGQAPTYVTTQAALMGLNVRVGMEDTYYKWPNSKELLSSNSEATKFAIDIAKLLNISVATPKEAREMLGL